MLWSRQWSHGWEVDYSWSLVFHSSTTLDYFSLRIRNVVIGVNLTIIPPIFSAENNGHAILFCKEKQKTVCIDSAKPHDFAVLTFLMKSHEGFPSHSSPDPNKKVTNILLLHFLQNLLCILHKLIMKRFCWSVWRCSQCPWLFRPLNNAKNPRFPPPAL